MDIYFVCLFLGTNVLFDLAPMLMTKQSAIKLNVLIKQEEQKIG